MQAKLANILKDRWNQPRKLAKTNNDGTFASTWQAKRKQKRRKESWKIGRRIVELEVLVNGLRSCKECREPLMLKNVRGETKFGLGGFLQVLCKNPACRLVNNVPLGKRNSIGSGKKVWDVNSKAATGMLHVGIGETQLNNLLTTMNLPTISKHALKAREREVGSTIEKVAKASVEKSLEQEIQASKKPENNGYCVISGSIDAGWQSRGSGHAYNSVSGHATVVGSKTGKVIAFETRIKSCRVCEYAKNKGIKVRNHSCRKNWDGSSKAMEADMAVSMIKNINSKKKATVGTVIGDEDSTIISRLKNEVSQQIEKKSDSNHIKKILGTQLFNLKDKHKLSVKTIKYFQKLFNYMCKQNSGKPEAIEKGLDALYLHPFDDHSQCDSSWCQHKGNTAAKFLSLPYGRPLGDPDLQQSLKEIFIKYKGQSQKLAHLESSQANENFNGLVSTKAPKRQHYSGSESLDYRVSASTCQKNMGYDYLVQVNSEARLSLGSNTVKRAKYLNTFKKKNKIRKSSRAAKRKRLELKAKKMSSNASKEVREGDTYSTSIDLMTDSHDTYKIPDPVLGPEPVTADEICPSFIFDLETTGLGRNSHILQIAAVACHSNESFSCYVLPKIPIESKASKVTGLECNNGQLFFKNEPVPALPVKEALKRFIEFLGKKPVLLVGHNIKVFDCHVLLNAAESCGMLARMEQIVVGFLDTLLLFMATHAHLPSYKQENLYNQITGKSYDAHNALSDITALKELMSVASFSVEVKKKFSFNLDYIKHLKNYNQQRDKNLLSWRQMVKSKCISKGMAGKAAGSGLTKDHLRLAYRRRGMEGLQSLLSEVTVKGKVRVTKNKKIIEKIASYLEGQTIKE